MQAKAEINGSHDLYSFWGGRLYEEVRDDSGIIVNLASKEYSVCIEKYLAPGDTFIICTFAEEEQGRLVQKGVYCKMARGEMVRFMAEQQIVNPEQVKSFNRLNYRFDESRSDDNTYIFLRDTAGEA